MAREPYWKRAAHDLHGELNNLTLRDLRRMQAQLREALAATVEDLAETRGEWSRARLVGLVERLNRRMAAIETRISEITRAGIRDAASGSTTAADEVARRYQADSSLIRAQAPSGELTQAIWMDFALDLVKKGITQPVKTDIERALRTGWLTGKSPYDVMKQLQSKDFETLTFKTKFHRAEAIVRTEYGRVANEAHFTRLLQYAESDERARKAGLKPPEPEPGEKIATEWLKDWVHTEDDRTRDSHRDVGGVAPIPVRAEFDVGGFPALYPQDPRLPAKESVNCRCVLAGVPPGAPLE